MRTLLSHHVRRRSVTQMAPSSVVENSVVPVRPLVADLNQADGIIGDCDLDILIVEFPQAGREAVVEAVVGGHRQEAGR